MEDSHSVITLRAGRAAVGIAPYIGGSITHFHWLDGNRHLDWLRPSSPAAIASATAGRLASFPLVPFSNRIRAGRFVFGGHAVQLPLNQPPEPHAQHGHGWQVAWTVVERATDQLVIVYDHAPDAWPFPYRARQQFTLSEDELSVTLEIENRGSESMPAGLGLHPYFPRTERCRLSAHVAGMWATDGEVMPTAMVKADPRLGESDGLPMTKVALDNVFTGWQRAARIVWPERGAQLAIAAHAPLDFLVVYSPAGEDFFCAEPVSHCTDAFNLAAQGRTDTGMLTLGAGSSLAVTVRFRPSLA